MMEITLGFLGVIAFLALIGLCVIAGLIKHCVEIKEKAKKEES
jgi:hypothetical protein